MALTAEDEEEIERLVSTDRTVLKFAKEGGRSRSWRPLLVRSSFRRRVAAVCVLKCARCNRAGHAARECTFRPFLRHKTEAEERAERLARRADREARAAERQEKQAAWEARQQERKEKHAEWEAKQQEWQRRQKDGKHRDLDSCSVCTDASTAVGSVALTAEDEEEIERLVSTDRAVLKLAKKLRDIQKLEARGDLDALQKRKLEGKRDAEVELETARGLARARARNEVRAKA